VEILALRLFALPVRLLPRRMALGLGGFVGMVAWWSRIRRDVVLANLRQALPEASEAERVAVGRQAARNFGRTSAEFLRFAGRDRERVGQLINIDDLEELRAALVEGKGAVIVTAHLGAWALYVGALAAGGIPSALLVGKQTNPRVDRLILGIPGDAVRFVSKGKRAPRQILECLRDGLAVVMVADHYISSETVWAPFLGRNASTLPLLGALLAKKCAASGTRTAVTGSRSGVWWRPPTSKATSFGSRWRPCATLSWVAKSSPTPSSTGGTTSAGRCAGWTTAAGRCWDNGRTSQPPGSHFPLACFEKTRLFRAGGKRTLNREDAKSAKRENQEGK